MRRRRARDRSARSERMSEETWAAVWLLTTAAGVVAGAVREAVDYIESGIARRTTPADADASLAG